MTSPKTPQTISPEVLAYIKETFSLDGETVLRKGKPIRHRATAERAQYRKVHIGRFNGKPVKWKLSRLKLYLHTGKLPAVVDHRSGITRDDSLANLRAATVAQNCANRGAKRTKRGALPRGIDQPGGPSGSFRVRIGHGRRAIHVGTYPTCEEAVAARNAAEKPLKGAFHRPRRKVAAHARSSRRYARRARVSQCIKSSHRRRKL